MGTSRTITVECIRCRHEWLVDLIKLGKPDTTIFKGNQPVEVQTFRLTCPNCGTVSMLDVAKEPRDA